MSLKPKLHPLYRCYIRLIRFHLFMLMLAFGTLWFLYEQTADRELSWGCAALLIVPGILAGLYFSFFQKCPNCGRHCLTVSEHMDSDVVVGFGWVRTYHELHCRHCHQLWETDLATIRNSFVRGWPVKVDEEGREC